MRLSDLPLYQRLKFRARASKYARRVDPLEIRFLRSVLRPGDLALDVGAHKGGYLYWLQRAVGPTGHLLAFEPQPEAAAYLRYIAGISGYAQVEILENAVSDRAGPVTLFTPASRVSTGATLVAGLFPENDTSRPVTAVTLDGYLATRRDLPAPRAIKVDVETHELAVLRGARQTLTSAKPLVMFEADQRVYGERPIAELFDFLSALGLSGYFFFEKQLLPVRTFDAAHHQPEALRHTPNDFGYANNFLFMDAAREADLLRRYGTA